MHKSIKHMLIVGFALFSMLFGAGNVIFPPYLGLECGDRWLEGFLYYYIADIGLAIACLIAIQKNGGQRKITRHLGKVPAEILNSLIVLCIGPMVGIPRTAASTLEMSVEPLWGRVNPVAFSCVFFLLIALLCMRETAIVDIIGKILTPVLMVSLLVVIIKGTVTPLGPAQGEVLVENVPVTGIKAGYQTMDVLAVTVFGIVLSKNVREKGYGDVRQQNRIIFGAGAVAGSSLLLMYLGLTYLGVTASGRFDTTVNRTQLVTAIVQQLLGRAGTVIFAVVVALACITTAVALVSACADHFSTLSGGRVSYRTLVGVVCIGSALITTCGLDRIIAIAAPVLDVLYPPTLFILLLSCFDKWIHSDWVYRLGAAGATAVSLLTVLAGFGLPGSFLEYLPLHTYGFGWLVPAAVCALVGSFIPCRAKKA